MLPYSGLETELHDVLVIFALLVGPTIYAMTVSGDNVPHCRLTDQRHRNQRHSAHHPPLRSDLHRPCHCGHQSSASQNQTQGPLARESLRHSVKSSSDRAPQPLDRILPPSHHPSEDPKRHHAAVSVSQRRVKNHAIEIHYVLRISMPYLNNLTG